VHYDKDQYKKRPFCNEFLEKVSNFYEVVIFTAGTQDYADEILDSIDPAHSLIKYRLYRQHTSLHNDVSVKDLSKIGRDMKRTLIVDNIRDNFRL